MPFTHNRIDIISLGCSKNLIDSERLLRRLAAKGYTMSHDPETPAGEYVVVNTCGFIGDAKEESVNMLLQLAQMKGNGDIGKIAVMGCLSQRYMDELKEAIPEVDLWYGKFDWNAFVTSLPDVAPTKTAVKEWQRTVTTPPHTAYLKISEGCNRFCAFCAIPLITGRHTSRPMEEIEEEVRDLVKSGVSELNVIAQDLSSYGIDLYGGHRLAQLVDCLADIPGVRRIRLHYAYPSDFPYDVLEVMRRRDNVCSYMDIALQHISDKMLTAMRRHINKEETLQLIDRMRREVPDLKLRTTLMVGFPGETEEDFQELLDFVRTVRFERMGAFAYSEEEGTYAAMHLADDVPEETKQQRLDTLMKLQQEISLELQQEMIGKRLTVVVDTVNADGSAICRTQWDSPEVDPELIVDRTDAKPGDYIEVEVTDAAEFELYGRQITATAN